MQLMAAADVLLVSLGSTAGLRAADDGARRRAAARGRQRRGRGRAAPRELRTYALTDLAWARAARVAARAGIAAHAPRAIVYSTTTAALLWPRPGAIRFDAPAAANRPGATASGSARSSAGGSRGAAAAAVGRRLAGGGAAPARRRDRRPDRRRALAGDRRAARHRGDHVRRQPAEEGPGPRARRVGAARADDEQLVVAGADLRLDAPGVRVAGRLAPAEYRALLRRARVFVTAPRREDYGIAQLEALADGCVLVTTAAPGPYAALPLARALDPRLVADDRPGSPPRCAPRWTRPRRSTPSAPPPRSPRSRRAAVDAVVRDELLPRLLGRGDARRVGARDAPADGARVLGQRPHDEGREQQQPGIDPASSSTSTRTGRLPQPLPSSTARRRSPSSSA